MTAELARLEAKMVDADLAGNVTLRDAYARRIEAIKASVVAGNVVVGRFGGR